MTKEVGMSRKLTKGKPGSDEGPAASRVEDLPERWSAHGSCQVE